MTSGSFDEAQLGKLDEVEWTMLTPHPSAEGSGRIWEFVVLSCLGKPQSQAEPSLLCSAPIACSPGAEA